MAEKKFNNVRIINKHDTESNWLKAAGFTPKQGELIVYDIDENYSYERFKIGDGIRNVNDLPFSLEDALAQKSQVRLTVSESSEILPVLNIHKMSQEEYDQAVSNGTIEENAIYLTPDEDDDYVTIEQLEELTADDLGIYVQAQEPTNAVPGDIWIDTANDPTYIPPTLPEITDADNGKVLMVVNGQLQLVSLNLSIDANGVVSI